jgi:dihydroorotase
MSNLKIKIESGRAKVDFDLQHLVSAFSLPNKLRTDSSYILVPGFLDVHVHLREPGFSYKETIKTGSMAAARGEPYRSVRVEKDRRRTPSGDGEIRHHNT